MPPRRSRGSGRRSRPSHRSRRSPPSRRSRPSRRAYKGDSPSSSLREALSPLYNAPDFEENIDDYAIQAAKRIAKLPLLHLTKAERHLVDTELPKLQDFPQMRKLAFQRLMGVAPPATSKEPSQNRLRIEHLAITLTLERMRGSKLGNILYDDAQKMYASKDVLPALKKVAQKMLPHNSQEEASEKVRRFASEMQVTRKIPAKEWEMYMLTLLSKQWFASEMVDHDQDRVLELGKLAVRRFPSDPSQRFTLDGTSYDKRREYYLRDP